MRVFLTGRVGEIVGDVGVGGGRTEAVDVWVMLHTIIHGEFD